jgi:eukaryotic-like serine/threonine-protein kinase
MVQGSKTSPEQTEPDEPFAADWRGTRRYEVVRCIGRGGMGIVYEARDRDLHRRVALKTLLDFDPASLLRFKQEFRTLADVQHPNLVRLHEFVGDESERVFFSMELVRGTDFVAYVQPGAQHGGASSDTVRLPSTGEAPSGVQRRSTPPAPPPTASSPEGAETADMSLYAAAARHRLGLALGGDEGSRLIEEAARAMTAQGVRVPARFAAMLIPGRWTSDAGGGPNTATEMAKGTAD